MTNNKKTRLIQVAKEFKVGLSTITDYLLKKGVGADLSPNSPVSPEVYAMLEKEFGSNRSITGNERDNIRERISLNKQATVSLGGEKKESKAEEQEVIIKSNVISVKDEVQQPKILGKIDLEPKKKEQPKPQPQPEVKPEPKPQPKPEPKPEPKPATPAPKVEEPKAEEPK